MKRMEFPDLTQIVSGVPERARDIERAIEKCIREFEPRLTTVEVEHFLIQRDR